MACQTAYPLDNFLRVNKTAKSTRFSGRLLNYMRHKWCSQKERPIVMVRYNFQLLVHIMATSFRFFDFKSKQIENGFWRESFKLSCIWVSWKFGVLI